MKKTILLTAGFMLLATLAWADQIELGIGAAPMPGGGSQSQSPDQQGQDNTLKVLRAAYTTFGVVNFSLDSLILPPYMIESLSSRWVEDPAAPGGGYFTQGYFRPGMVNLIDAGIKFALFDKFIVGAQFGVNSLYIYHQDEITRLDPSFKIDMGANIKLSTGYKFGEALGVEIAMYSIQPSVSVAINTITGLFNPDSAVQQFSQQQLFNTAAYAALIVLYL